MKQPQKILVTGATGFVGQHLCRLLVDCGFEVVRALRTKSRQMADHDVVVGEIDSGTDWRTALEGCNIVIHLAAKVHNNNGPRQKQDDHHEVNTLGSLNLAQQCVSHGVKRLIFISTVKVNGESSDVAFQESDAANPGDAYGQSKYEAEQGLLEISKQSSLEVTILRPPLVYGPGVGANFRRLMHLTKSGIPLPFARINNQRSLIFVGNLCDAIKVCLENPHAAGRIFLVSDGAAISTSRLIQSFAENLGRPNRLFYVPIPFLHFLGLLVGKRKEIDRLTGSLVIDSSAIVKILDWHPPYTFEEGLRLTTTWYQKGQS